MSSLHPAEDHVVSLTNSTASVDDPPVAISHVVLTGGPGGGKTSGLKELNAFFIQRGFLVVNVAEVAAYLIQNDPRWASPDQRRGNDGGASFQRAIYGTQLAWDEMAKELAVRASRESIHSKPVLIINDRGPLDSLAYTQDTDEVEFRLEQRSVVRCTSAEVANALDDEKMRPLMEELRHNMTHDDLELKLGLICAQYDGIFHLVTAAELEAGGGNSTYTNTKASYRLEGPEQACRIDKLLRAAYSRHSFANYHKILNPGSNFQRKIQDLLIRMCTIVYRNDLPAQNAAIRDACRWRIRQVEKHPAIVIPNPETKSVTEEANTKATTDDSVLGRLLHLLF